MDVMFISYNGALEPLLQSQGIPYLKGLSRNGVKLVLLTFEKKLNFKKREAVEDLNAELRKNNIEWYRLAYHKNPPIFSTIYDIITGSIYCAYLIFKRKITVIHARSYVPAAIAYILKKCFKTKFVFDMRGMMIDEYAEAKILKKNGIIYRLTKKIEEKFLISSEKIIVLTKKIKNIIKNFNYLQNKFDLNIEVIPCCVDLQKFSYGKQKKDLRQNLNLKNKFIFIYIGSVGTWYFLEGMLDFFLIVKTIIPGAHFLFLSQGNRKFIKNSILKKNLDLKDFTIMQAEYNKISDYASESDAGMIFYKQTFSRFACCPVKFAEYLACGIPVVISSGVGDTAEIVRKERVGVVIDSFSENSYLNAVKELRELLGEGDLLRQRCRCAAENFFSLNDGIEKYLKIYHDLLKI